MRRAVWHVDSDRLDLEWNGAVFGKHRSDHVDDNVTGDQLQSDGRLHHHAYKTTTYSLVLSVAVVSIKMFFVFPGTILESGLSAQERAYDRDGLNLR